MRILNLTRTPITLADSASVDAFGRLRVSTPENIFDSNVSSSQVTSLLKSVLSIAKSKQIKTCLFKCSERAVLGDQKISPDFFEELKNRGLYYKIMLEVLKVNLIPFYKSLFSGSGNLIKTVTSFLKQK